MENRLLTTLSQQQALSLDQQQSLRILQMPAVELIGEIEWMLEDNPLLEKDGENEPASKAKESEPSDDYSDDVAAPAESPVDVPYAIWHGNASDESPFENIAADTSFRDELHADLACLPISARMRQLVTCLIEELDERGFLAESIHSMSALYAKILDEEGIHHVGSHEWQHALRTLQSMDPPGIGAAGPVDSLILQTRRLRADGRISTSIADAIELLTTKELGKIAANNRPALLRILGGDEALLNQALEVLKQLSPYPIARENRTLYIVPEILVQTTNGCSRAVLNPAAQQQIHLRSQSEFNKIQQQISAASWHAMISEAKAFIQRLEARQQTLKRLADAIVARQQAFFTDGPTALRPMTQGQIAEELKLSVATVSRAVSGKFMACRHGTIELRSMFSAVTYGDEDQQSNQSATQIQALISQMIASENPRQPLSDDILCSKLQEKGISIARRTVAKYRTNAGIPTARARKRC